MTENRDDELSARAELRRKWADITNDPEIIASEAFYREKLRHSHAMSSFQYEQLRIARKDKVVFFDKKKPNERVIDVA